MKTAMTKLLTAGLTTLALAAVFTTLAAQSAQAKPIPKELPPIGLCSHCEQEIRTESETCQLVSCDTGCQYACQPTSKGD